MIYTFINRLRPIARYIVEGHYATRVGGSIAVGGTRHGGQETTLESLNNFFFCTGMTVVSGGSIWSNDKKEQGAKEDKIGMATVKIIGRRVALTAKLLKIGLESSPQELEPGVLAGFPNQATLENWLEAFRHR